jgi:hypothetical protein
VDDRNVTDCTWLCLRLAGLFFRLSMSIYSLSTKASKSEGGAGSNQPLRAAATSPPLSIYSVTNKDEGHADGRKARQPETKLGVIAQTHHIARLRNSKRSRTKHPKPTHGARDRSKQPQPRSGRDHAAGSGQRHASRRTRPTDTGTRCPAKGNAKLPERPRDEGCPREARLASLHGLVGQVPEQRQGRGPKAPTGLDRHRHEGQGGGHLPIRSPLGGVPGSGTPPSRKHGGKRSAPSKGGNRRVDDRNVTDCTWLCLRLAGLFFRLSMSIYSLSTKASKSEGGAGSNQPLRAAATSPPLSIYSVTNKDEGHADGRKARQPETKPGAIGDVSVIHPAVASFAGGAALTPVFAAGPGPQGARRT